MGRIFRDYGTRGELVPDDVTVRLWAETVRDWVDADQYHPAQDLLILDGIPRTVQQAKLMDDHIEVLKVLHLVCADREAVVERLRKRAQKQRTRRTRSRATQNARNKRPSRATAPHTHSVYHGLPPRIPTFFATTAPPRAQTRPQHSPRCSVPRAT